MSRLDKPQAEILTLSDDQEQSITILNEEKKRQALIAFKEEIKGITDMLDALRIKYEIIYGAVAWSN